MEAEPTHKPAPPLPHGQSPQSLSRAHFEAMAALRGGFEQYREGHERMIKEEMQVLREEMEMKERLRTTGLDCSSYESEVEEVRAYVTRMQQFLGAKMQVFQQMQGQLERLRGQTTQAHELNLKMRQANWREQAPTVRQQVPQQYYPMHDEQLLEGLSGDDHIAKLF